LGRVNAAARPRLLADLAGLRQDALPLSTSPSTDWKRLLPRGHFLAAALAIALIS
jgi:hypothetical protein